MKYKLVFITIAVAVFASCSKPKLNDNLEGTWVSTDSAHDTIYFYKPSMGMLDVKRAFVNGVQRMLGSGSYIYNLKTDSISVQFLLSSAYYGDHYYYLKKDGNEFTIGNFFALEKSSMVTKFQKISN